MEYVKAFLTGGALCLLGQILIDKTKLTPARILVSYVVAGVLLGGLGLYQPFSEFAGAGATVPLTGFGNTLAKGVKEAVQADGFIGIFTGGLKASAGGIPAAITAGLLGTLLGNYLGPNVNAKLLKKALGVLFLITGIRELRYKSE